MDDYGVNKGVTIVGASGTVTSQNLGAIGKSANGFVTGVGYSPKLDNPANKQFVADFQKAYSKLPDLYGADSYGLLYFYKAAVEKAMSTDTDKVRAAMNDLSWQTPQGIKKMRAGDHQAMQDMFAVRIENGEFNIVGTVAADQAIGPDVCDRF
jgi:branched-chain amino acid transport system substrate-binding protein